MNLLLCFICITKLKNKNIWKQDGDLSYNISIVANYINQNIIARNDSILLVQSFDLNPLGFFL